MRVLLIGHACSPNHGSEASFTWNWAWHLSRWHQVWVLTHPYGREAVMEFLANHPRPNLKFIWIDVPRWIDPWASRPGDRGLRLHYLVWLSIACKKAIALHEQIRFDVAHHVSYGTISAPPPVSQFPFPFIWGPLGGAQRSPFQFRRYFGWSWPWEIARDFRLRLLALSPALHETARNSAVVLATNQETAELLTRVGARDVRMFLDSGIPTSFGSQEPASIPKKDGRFTLLWVGRMQRRKALPLALEVLAMIKDLSVRLLIAGDGEMRGSCEKYAKRLNIENKVDFLGRIPWDEMARLYQSTEALLFTSLRDSFGTQVLEAMGHGLPILALNHQGVRTFVPPEAGIKVPVTSPQQTLSDLAEAVRRVALFPEERRRMSETALTYAKTQTWERRAERMSQIYEEVCKTSSRQAAKAVSSSEEVTVKFGEPAAYGSHAVTKRMAAIDSTIDLKGKRVLDLGCGNGSYTGELARRAESVCAADILMSNLKAFQTRIPRFQAAGENLPFASDTFDAVTMIEVLEHTHCDTRVLGECFRVLKPGGLLVVFVPNKLYPFESHPCHVGNLSLGPNIPLVSWFPKILRKHLCHARIYTRRALFSMAKQAGFQIQKSRYIFPPLDSLRLPFKATYRKLIRYLERTPLAIFGVSIYAVLEKSKRITESARTPPNRRSSSVPSYETLGVRVHAVQISNVVAYMEQWIHERGPCRSVAATGMHGVVESQHDPGFKQILNNTDLILPDGTPLVWVGRRQGHDLARRVYGPDLMLAFCEESQTCGYRHFFYGGEPGVAEKLAESLKRRFPGMQVAGVFSPPFRPLTKEEDMKILSIMSRCAPDVLWVGLGAPKQERWMHEHRNKLNVPVVVGVGAAFDMISGRRKQAPRWMREHGLEWFFRLFQEPRRLWRRYLIYGTQFVAWIVLESLGLKKFGPGANEGKPQTGSLP